MRNCARVPDAGRWLMRLPRGWRRMRQWCHPLTKSRRAGGAHAPRVGRPGVLPMDLSRRELLTASALLLASPKAAFSGNAQAATAAADAGAAAGAVAGTGA